MNRPAATAVVVTRTHHALGLGLGMLLGHAVIAMSQLREGSVLGFVAAMVFIASSSASFVLFVLGRGDMTGTRRDVQARQVYGLLGAIGLGLLVSMRAPDLLG